ncbi:hypothetical protein BaRGS_00009906 [Batillaria attramentaria]|uniref:Uncharacterized protein n=1 Tax=Batillaria attramentaria TaxID=370345 RepID=A0ABD0LH54_9CAEN
MQLERPGLGSRVCPPGGRPKYKTEEVHDSKAGRTLLGEIFISTEKTPVLGVYNGHAFWKLYLKLMAADVRLTSVPSVQSRFTLSRLGPASVTTLTGVIVPHLTDTIIVMSQLLLRANPHGQVDNAGQDTLPRHQVAAPVPDAEIAGPTAVRVTLLTAGRLCATHIQKY